MSLASLISAKTDTGAGGWVAVNKNVTSFVASLSNTTTPAATVYLEYTPDGGTTVVRVATFTLSGALDAAIATLNMAPGHFRANVNAISGTSAAATVKARF